VAGRSYVENQAFFRAVNEKVLELSTPAGEPLSFLCECGVIACAVRLELTAAEYEAVRAHPARFLVSLGHEQPDENERVVETHAGFLVVEKQGPDAAAIAVASDPRAHSSRLVERAVLGEAADHAEIAVFVGTSDGVQLAVNDRACQLVGYERDEVIGCHGSALTTETAARLRSLWNELEANGSLERAAVIRRKDGTLVPVRYRAHLTQIGDTPAYVSFVEPAA
jgi:PAS domain S-box-containing protein